MRSHESAENENEYEAAALDRSLAEKAMSDGEFATALDHLEKAGARISRFLGLPHFDALLLSMAFDLSRLRLVLGKGLGEIPEFLQQARAAATRLGDRRSLALVRLHLGRFFYLSDRLSDALKSLDAGLAQVKDLGDEDILTRAAEFEGLRYYLHGMHVEATEHFERSMQSSQTKQGKVVDFLIPIFLGYSAAYMGQFHRAIGVVDCSLRSALRESEHSLSNILRAVLGFVLLRAGKNREASSHLRAAQKEARAQNNLLALFLCEAPLAYLHYIEGRPVESHETSVQLASRAAAAGVTWRQYNLPWVLELVFRFHQLGYENVPGYDLRGEMERLINGPNVHLQGVAFRLRAIEAADRGDDPLVTRSNLESSEACLRRCGDPIDLAKTRVEMARLEFRQGNRSRAEELALQAWGELAKYGKAHFPDELKPFLKRRVSEKKTLPEEAKVLREEALGRFLDMVEGFIPSTNLDELLGRVLVASSRFLLAERSGLFWFEDSRPRARPRLRVACNLTAADVASENFRANLGLIFDAFRNNRPQVVRHGQPEAVGTDRVLSILCLPFELRGQVRGVLYYDNSYMEDGFDFLDMSMLPRIGQHMSVYIGRLWEYCRLTQEKRIMASEQSEHTELADSLEMRAASPVMVRLLMQADQIADSEAAVLILGETGVGKEVLARRLHKMSSRHSGPFVVVDLTSVPENLVESELFGHEKGAFTGADRQRVGRLELAHRGTLFIDEVGEIPKSMQVKLLRVLQEKAFARLGGTRPVVSDFRLVAATNRELKAEVDAGRFRQDLYYRLNVVPVRLPPLRERGKDVVLLAQHFLRYYTRRYNKCTLRLSANHEERLTAHDWPGNVRELKNVIERGVIMSSGDRLELDLPVGSPSRHGHPLAETPTLDEMQRRYILSVLDMTGGRISGKGGAAELLGMKRTSLYTRMKNLGMNLPRR
jgi:transcriptional regulator with GAF, ATPase, and Fis domain